MSFAQVWYLVVIHSTVLSRDQIIQGFVYVE